MTGLKDYIIQFSGLKNGLHQFDYEVDDRFFELFDYSEIKKGNVKVGLTFEKKERMLILTFSISGVVAVICDRCLDEFDEYVESTHRLIFKFGKELGEESDDIVIIPESQYQVDISHHIYEYIALALPIQKIHPLGPKGEMLCNAEMIAKINPADNAEKNDERWKELKKLKTH